MVNTFKFSFTTTFIPLLLYRSQDPSALDTETEQPLPLFLSLKITIQNKNKNHIRNRNFMSALSEVFSISDHAHPPKSEALNEVPHLVCFYYITECQSKYTCMQFANLLGNT